MVGSGGPAVLAPPPGPTLSVHGITVQDGPVSPPWNAPVQGGRGATAWYADADRLLVTGPTAGLTVERGCRVTMRADDRRARLEHDYLVYAWAARVLLQQQRRFALHATLVVSPGGQAVAIGGPSMAGKSTTAIELTRRGWTFAGDDIVAVRPGSGTPVAHPVDRPIHLSDEAAVRLGADPAIGRPLPGRAKRVYALTSDLRPRPLSLIVIVGRTPGERIEVEHHHGLAALPRLTLLTDSIGLAARLVPWRADLFHWAAGIAAAVPVLTVRRPADRPTVEAMADTVQDLADAATGRWGPPNVILPTTDRAPGSHPVG